MSHDLNDKMVKVRDTTETAVTLVETSKTPGGVVLVNSWRTTKNDQLDLIELAQQVQKADEFTKANAVSKLSVIAEQIKFLQQQAKNILLEAKENDELHHVACNFKKEPGNVYNMYKRSSGQKYLSMLSPLEWGPSCPHEFLGSYRLEHDMSWTKESMMAKRDNEIGVVAAIVDYQLGKGSGVSGSDIVASLAHGQIS